MLLVGTIVAPLVLGALGAYFSYRAAYQNAAAALTEAVAVAEENTAKILDTHALVAARIDDLLRGLSDNEIRAREKPLHDQIARQIQDMPQVAAAWTIDANGRELVSARVYPVNHDLDLSLRDDFRALQGSRQETFIWPLRARSLDRGNVEPYFTVSRARHGADGSFQGIVVVAVSGDYLASFYNSLLGGSAQYTASVVREDGTSLVRYPERAERSSLNDELLAKAIADRTAGGTIESGSRFGADGSLIAYKRLANYPVYVAIGRSRASILRGWAQTAGGYAAIGVPAAIGFVLLSLMALRRTRREQLALAREHDATVQRAALEAQLHQAQKLEAVGLLTAGIAHDFNNLLTVVSGNVMLLQIDLEAGDPRQRRLIGAAMSGCERATALAKRLLEFARREPVDPRTVDINEVIGRFSDLPWHSSSDRITVEYRQASDLWPVFVDPNQLENSLLNLALNARDAMAGGGTLTFETANLRLVEAVAAEYPGVVPGSYVVIAVRDTGCGMSAEVRERAFDPFFTTKGEGKGTGLGLSQVHGFVTRFGGRCTIDSEPGRGTTIRLYLPRFPADTEAAEPGAASSDGEPARAAASPPANGIGDGPYPAAAERNATS